MKASKRGKAKRRLQGVANRWQWKRDVGERDLEVALRALYGAHRAYHASSSGRLDVWLRDGFLHAGGKRVLAIRHGAVVNPLRDIVRSLLYSASRDPRPEAPGIAIAVLVRSVAAMDSAGVHGSLGKHS